jgi:chemotaxis protein MotB
MLNEETPVIIKKVKGSGHGSHGGAWKVAYADFVTAMMALFIVLWVLSQDDSVKTAVAGYFKDPVGFSDKSRSIIDGNSAGIINPDTDTAFLEREAEKLELQKMGEKIMGELSANPDFADIADQIRIENAEEGLRIEMMESTDDVFFEIGTAKLKPEAEKLIIKIGDYLARINNKIILEGHTDSRQYVNTRSDYTNYELSADRANSARRAIYLSMLGKNQVEEIRGYADKKLRDPEDPFNVINRRISIIVKYSK